MSSFTEDDPAAVLQWGLPSCGIEPDLCERCRLPVLGTPYRMRVAADLPGARGTELRLCKTCLASMQRWLARRHRQPDLVGMGVVSSNTRSPSPVSGPCCSRLESNPRDTDTAMRYRSFLALAVSVLAFLATGALVFGMMMAGSHNNLGAGQ